MTWSDHIEYITRKVTKRIGVLRSLKYKVGRSCLKQIYVSYIRPILEYCDVIWDICTTNLFLDIKRLQNDCLRVMTGLTRYCRTDNLYLDSGLAPLHERRRQHRLVLLFKAILGECPPYFHQLLPILRIDPHTRSNRNLYSFELNICHLSTFRHSYIPRTVRDWNELDIQMRTATTTYVLFQTSNN